MTATYFGYDLPAEGWRKKGTEEKRGDCVVITLFEERLGSTSDHIRSAGGMVPNGDKCGDRPYTRNHCTRRKGHNGAHKGGYEIGDGPLFQRVWWYEDDDDFFKELGL